jgi:hypothetical protein
MTTVASALARRSAHASWGVGRHAVSTIVGPPLQRSATATHVGVTRSSCPSQPRTLSSR